LVVFMAAVEAAAAEAVVAGAAGAAAVVAAEGAAEEGRRRLTKPQSYQRITSASARTPVTICDSVRFA
jgi:hypothetical protein